jgi:tetratricopeptide (TPR) repeat protein
MQKAEDLLRSAMMLSKQSRYERRAPSKESVPLLQNALGHLMELTKEQPRNPKAWELTSLAYECLLQYDASLVCLRKAIAIDGKPSKLQKKRLAMIQACSTKWAELLLSVDQLRSLEEFLKTNRADERSDVRTLELTKKWLEDEGTVDAAAVISQLGERGAFSDFQIYHNICLG